MCFFFFKKDCVILKIIVKKFGSFQKNSYLCITDAKRTKASKICGMAMEIIFLSARESSVWLNGKTRHKGIGFKEKENFLHP